MTNKQRVCDLISSSKGPVFFDKISSKLNISVRAAVKACDELMREGKITVNFTPRRKKK